VRLVLVTGRRLPGARLVTRELGAELPLVLHNGALIVDAGALLRVRPLPRAVALRALRAGIEAGADPVLHCGLAGEGRLVVADGLRPSNTLLAYYLDRSHPDVTSVGDLLAWLREDPIQVMYGGELGEMQALHAALAAALGEDARLERTLYPRQGVGILDVLEPAVNKAEALAFLQARWGIPPAQTLAIGDNWNDLGMLEAAGLGYVMGNADAELLARGLPVLPTNDEDGVALAIERHLLA
jgi:hydroxymethylpyrimidine pyrophosphatase-like HAD family hydrolase